jgi:hypothetical protein
MVDGPVRRPVAAPRDGSEAVKPPSLLEVVAARPQELLRLPLAPLLLAVAAFAVIFVSVIGDHGERAGAVGAAREWGNTT